MFWDGHSFTMAALLAKLIFNVPGMCMLPVWRALLPDQTLTGIKLLIRKVMTQLAVGNILSLLTVFGSDQSRRCIGDNIDLLYVLQVMLGLDWTCSDANNDYNCKMVCLKNQCQGYSLQSSDLSVDVLILVVVAALVAVCQCGRLDDTHRYG